MKCIIIDDEPLAIELLSDYVGKMPELELVGTYTNPIEALHSLEKEPVDLVFLDIQMPELTGIQFMKITKGKTQFILTTAYENYALESYEYEVVDYLLKPITLDRFMVSLEKVKRKNSGTEEQPIIQKTASNFMFVKSGHKTQKVKFDDILYFEGLSDYVAIHSPEGKILTLEKMKHFAATLPAERFVRVHKSFIISIEKIDFIERNRVVIGEKYIPIGATYAEEFWKKVKA